MSDGEKKHIATDRKRKQAREQGQVAKSQDLTSASLLLAAIGAIYYFGGQSASILVHGMKSAFSHTRLEAYSAQDATHELLRLAGQVGLATTPILLLMLVGAVAINVSQVGLILSPDKLMPKFSNISPLSGAQRIFSIRGLMRLLFSTVKVGAIIAVAYYALQAHQNRVVGMASMSVPQIASAMFHTLLGVCLWIASALFLLALLEWMFQKWQLEQDLMMTDQELRDEMKELEGGPKVTDRRREVSRQLAVDQVTNEVRAADVIIKTPHELAIAIRYDPATMASPVMVAKGAGLLGQQICRTAFQSRIAVVERELLAKFLYQHADVGQEVPATQYRAVAEALRDAGASRMGAEH
ncbi:EscU/YscU/HrcU family type III secretion system export apparatus switch protein [Allorhodopirellula solitaria]|uniref:Flagellar biosynthetic protein FlhB n=1 Tax=Allorhodopirellula solitaria TaxID=2527987 RepID=A0A5C5XUE1_9BACT|nr:EscU/YscU/HrcU family type III secretion system export apparatus switch protein [Allorhodopirellula solitaria]TWT66520.1 Flagellar biosynthetic protein FlhB [Allorhodopirellula solitaria]